MEEDPVLANTHKFYEWSKEEALQNWMRKFHYLYFNKDRHFYTRAELIPELQWPSAAHQGQVLFGLHFSMFLDSLRAFSTEEQLATWLPRALNMDILGCYAQTEIGHGSDVARL